MIKNTSLFSPLCSGKICFEYKWVFFVFSPNSLNVKNLKELRASFNLNNVITLSESRTVDLQKCVAIPVSFSYEKSDLFK